MLRKLTQTTGGLAALLALSPAAVAGTFTISPLRVDFAGAATTAALTVRNEDATAVVVQAEGAAWSQDGGQDALAPSRDLLVSPAVFTLPPGGQQLVRVALRRAADPSRELAYRLTLQEVPQAAAPGFTGLQVALRLSVPVFVAPTAPAAARLDWTLERGADGRPGVSVRNDGTAHARIQRFKLTPAEATAPVFEQAGLAYVLPGASRHWSFDDHPDTRTNATAGQVSGTAGGYRLEGTTDRGAFATELAPPRD